MSAFYACRISITLKHLRHRQCCKMISWLHFFGAMFLWLNTTYCSNARPERSNELNCSVTEFSLYQKCEYTRYVSGDENDVQKQSHHFIKRNSQVISTSSWPRSLMASLLSIHEGINATYESIYHVCKNGTLKQSHWSPTFLSILE